MSPDWQEGQTYRVVFKSKKDFIPMTFTGIYMGVPPMTDPEGEWCWAFDIMPMPEMGVGFILLFQQSNEIIEVFKSTSTIGAVPHIVPREEKVQ